MRLLFCINRICNCGGTERVLLLIANELSRIGYDVHILTFRNSKKTFFDAVPELKINRLLCRLEELCLSSHPKYIIHKLRYKYLTIRPDVVIDTELLSANLSIPALQGLGIKHVVWDNFSYECFKKVYHEQIALDKIKQNGSHIVTLTRKDRQLYIKEQSVDPSKIHQIYNPLTYTKDAPIEHFNKKILSVGRFAHEKGFDMLLNAWKLVEQEVDGWSLEIWGDTGVDTGNVHETFNSLSLKRASLHPATSQIQKKYEEAGIYVLTSRHEGLGLVLLEASTYSLPLIAFDCPNGPREIIRDGENGILVEPEDVDALADAILRLIRDKELRERLGRNAYERSKDFQMCKIIPQWITLIENVIKS